MQIERLIILGAGQMGGSLALALRRTGFARHIALIDRSEAAIEGARRREMADAYDTAWRGGRLGAGDVLCLAVPLGAYDAVLDAFAPLINDGAILTDLGSTKALMRRAALPALPAGVAIAPGHPLAGTERAGPEAAAADIYRDTLTLLTPEAGENPDGIAVVEAMWRAAGARCLQFDPDRHDGIMALTSHLPQAASTALMRTIASLADSADMPPGDIYPLSAGALRDCTRIAGSDPDMWADIFMRNAGPVADAIAGLQAQLEALETAIRKGDRAAVHRLLSDGRAARRAYETAMGKPDAD